MIFGAVACLILAVMWTGVSFGLWDVSGSVDKASATLAIFGWWLVVICLELSLTKSRRP